MKIFLTIAVSILVFLLAGGYYVFMKACHRETELQWDDPRSLKNTQWAPLADRVHEAWDYLNDHGAHMVKTRSRDGLNLSARWLPAEKALGSILLFHGYRSCPLADFSVVIPYYHSLGFNLLLADQRSHGKSEGNYITFGIREHEDAQMWIDFHNQNFGELPVFLGGMSMGATTVLMAAGRKLPRNVKGVCADCGFTEPVQIIRHVMELAHVPAFPLLQIADLYARVLGRFSMREYSTVKAMASCRIPVLLFHGTDDHFVPCQMSQAAFDACPVEKQLILVEGATHGTSYLTDRIRCQAVIKEFLMSHLDN